MWTNGDRVSFRNINWIGNEKINIFPIYIVPNYPVYVENYRDFIGIDTIALD